jgi:uncharacterized protein YciI
MRLKIMIALLLALRTVHAGPDVPARGAFFALSVADARASAAWYQDLLGLHVTLETPKRDGVSVIVLEGEGLIVELIQHDEAMALPGSDPIRVHGFVKAGIIVDDFDAMVAKIRERKVPIVAGPFPKRDGQRANVIVRDNAGNMLQFFGR